MPANVAKALICSRSAKQYHHCTGTALRIARAARSAGLWMLPCIDGQDIGTVFHNH